MYSKKFDKILFFSILAILFIGILMLQSASSKYYSQNIVLRQVAWMLFGIILLFVASRMDYRKIANISYLLYAINLILLVLVLFFGKARGGAHRWINLGIFNLQPSELAKITLIFTLASFVSTRKKDVGNIRFLLGAFALVMPVVLLILIEPDLGTALLFIPITLAVLFVAGAKLSHIAGIVFTGVAALPILWQFLRDYQKQRLMVFIDPNIDPLGSGYTIIQSKIAIGSGGLFGKGWFAGTQNQLSFLPERHTDFIFSVIGEEWGFSGALILLALYALVIYRGIKIAEATPDTCGKLIATGFVALFALQVIINIGMTLGFLPVVGLTLPLISYGGSSLVTTLLSLGFLLSIGTRRTLF